MTDFETECWRSAFFRTLAGAGAAVALAIAASAPAAEPFRRKVILDEDVGAASDSNIQALALLLQAPGVQLVGVTVVAGDGPVEAATKHIAGLLRAIGRSEVPVVPGAAVPLLNTRAELKLWEEKYGPRLWKGMWNDRLAAGTPPAESRAGTSGQGESAADFLARTVRAQPGEITVIALGPLTNLALACALDPEFSGGVRELVIAAGIFDRKNRVLIGSNFNSYFDPEASRIVYRRRWKSVLAVSPESFSNIIISPEMERIMADAHTPLTEHLLLRPNPSRKYPMWDEASVVLWLDRSVATNAFERYLDIDLDRGASYGRVLVWEDGVQPNVGEPRATFVVDIDQARFNQRFIELITAPVKTRPTP